MTEIPVVFLMGPTASGKTATTAALSELLPIDVISVDAAQIYRGLDIGTAKPTLAFRRALPHRLIDIRTVDDTYSAAAFSTDARAAIEQSLRRERTPVLVGGSSFYFRALEQGLPALPAADPALRATWELRLQAEGLAALYAELARRDPDRAACIAPSDPQRIIRALEITNAVDKVPKLTPGADRLPYTILKFAVNPTDRTLLHQRIAARFRRMLVQGIIEEARWLYGLHLNPQLPALRLVGYRQVGEYLRGEIQYTELVEKGIAATRQLAKRQLTWLRADLEVAWLDASDTQAPARCAARIRDCIWRKQSSRPADNETP